VIGGPCVLRGAIPLVLLVFQRIGAVADPDILRRVFHSAQVPPAGFNRGFFRDPRVDALLDEAALTADEGKRRALYAEVQHVVAEQAPYISLWCKTNVAVAQKSLSGIRVPPIADFTVLKDVARTSDSHDRTGADRSH
jgi:peptide/nickel transport system substrate-binding protein